MILIFCNNVLEKTAVDVDYELELKTAKQLGFETYLISFEELEEGNVLKAIKKVEKQPLKKAGIYRGWMMTPENYELLYKQLLSKNIVLINTPTEYKHCHYLPHSYAKIAHKTPLSKWIECDTSVDDDTIIDLLKPFEKNAVIVKDFVKSEKHNWNSACFIANAADTQKALTVIHNFMHLRNTALNKGLVIRKFEKLKFLKKHAKSNMPLTSEYRLFFLYRKKLALFEYWDEGNYQKTTIPTDEFKGIATTINSNFFTMDIAQKTNGEWIIMELGDAQVAGLPNNTSVMEFYQQLNNHLTHK